MFVALQINEKGRKTNRTWLEYVTNVSFDIKINQRKQTFWMSNYSTEWSKLNRGMYGEHFSKGSIPNHDLNT